MSFFIVEGCCMSVNLVYLLIASAIALTNLNTREKTLKEIAKRISSTEDSILTVCK